MHKIKKRSVVVYGKPKISSYELGVELDQKKARGALTFHFTYYLI